MRALALVPRAPGRLSGPPAQGHDRGPGAKAPDRALAIPPGRGRAARDGAEASLTGDADNDMAGGIWAGATPANADRRIGPDPPGGAGPVGPRERWPGRNVGCLTAPLMESGAARLGAPPTRIWDRGGDAIPPDTRLARAPSPHGALPRHPQMPTRGGKGRCRPALNRTDLTQRSSYEGSSSSATIFSALVMK